MILMLLVFLSYYYAYYYYYSVIWNDTIFHKGLAAIKKKYWFLLWHGGERKRKTIEELPRENFSYVS